MESPSEPLPHSRTFRASLKLRFYSPKSLSNGRSQKGALQRPFCADTNRRRGDGAQKAGIIMYSRRVPP
jgi:hypothetical protein